jgi:hypothetical protein
MSALELLQEIHLLIKKEDDLKERLSHDEARDAAHYMKLGVKRHNLRVEICRLVIEEVAKFLGIDAVSAATMVAVSDFIGEGGLGGLEGAGTDRPIEWEMACDRLGFDSKPAGLYRKHAVSGTQWTAAILKAASDIVGPDEIFEAIHKGKREFVAALAEGHGCYFESVASNVKVLAVICDIEAKPIIQSTLPQQP